MFVCTPLSNRKLICSFHITSPLHSRIKAGYPKRTIGILPRDIHLPHHLWSIAGGHFINHSRGTGRRGVVVTEIEFDIAISELHYVPTEERVMRQDVVKH